MRQQSIAVLPPPITMTLPLIDVVWPNATLPSHSMPIVDVRARFLAARSDPADRGRAARRCRRNRHRTPSSRIAFMLVIVVAEVALDAHVENQIDFLFEHVHRAGGTPGSACASCRRRPGPFRTCALRNRAAADRAPPRAMPGRNRSTRCACRSSSSARAACNAVMSPLLSAATRFSRQIATGFSSVRTRRHAGSQGRSHVRPRIPGNTLESQLSMYASVYLSCAIRRMYSGTGVCAGHAHWQSTTLWK